MYVAIWDDRHGDTTAHLFTGKWTAVEWARDQANEVCCDKEGREEDWEEAWEDAPMTDTSHPLTQSDIKMGFIYRVRYSCEGDSIAVMEVEPDAELK